ncbi:hypothetical protein [Variovorax saccharolyticus]|uniref:hypothetical protein n=1 Tax=Variovorax saccharolyticus TaxID=3053516 RepID=UPI0025769CA5|nr:hypothetical protein [Variovorax sp. J31P216]MDM0029596.1 hypothetical protein [Variovorax sp. J31P216]
MKSQYSEELLHSVQRMNTALCGPAFDLEDVRATLGDDPTGIAGSIDPQEAPDVASALANAIRALHPPVSRFQEVRGVVAMVVTRSPAAQMLAVKELGEHLRAALPEDASVICAGALQTDLASDVQVQLWVRSR